MALFACRASDGGDVERRLEPLVLLDVRRAAEPFGDVAVLVEHRLGAHEVPSILAIARQQPELGLVELTRLERPLPARHRALDVVRVHAAGPPVAQQLVLREAEELRRALRDEVEQSVGPRGPHLHGDRLGHHAEARLAFLQRDGEPLGRVGARAQGRAWRGRA